MLGGWGLHWDLDTISALWHPAYLNRADLILHSGRPYWTGLGTMSGTYLLFIASHLSVSSVAVGGIIICSLCDVS